MLDCPAGTVMSRLGRARGKLRKFLEPRVSTDGYRIELAGFQLSKCDDIRGRLTLYLDDELQGTERATVEAHLSECDDCAGAFARELNFLNQVRQSGPLHVAPPELRAKVEQTLSDGKTVPVVAAERNRLRRSKPITSYAGWLRRQQSCWCCCCPS